MIRRKIFFYKTKSETSIYLNYFLLIPIDTPLTRRIPSQYQDGVYQLSGSSRPNPFTLSHELMRGDTGRACGSKKNVLLVFFGR
jgi:hypothetical protein